MTPLNYGARGSPGTDMWARHGPLNLNQHRTWGEMNAGLIILRVASLGRDAQNERDGAGLRCSVAAATPSQVAAATPSQLRRSSAARTMSGRRGIEQAIAWKICQKQGDITIIHHQTLFFLLSLSE